MHKKVDPNSDAWAIKIGGSLYESEYLNSWLDEISQHSNRKIIIIPGGGPFADQVRLADEKFRLSQIHSHNMAVMAMQQYGQMLASLCPAFMLANSTEKIHQAWSKRNAVIWQPYEMVRDQCDLAKSWSITSDSLAVWLASILEINNLLLVKSAKEVLENDNPVILAENNCIDPGLIELSSKSKIKLHFLYKANVSEFRSLLSSS